MLGTKYNHPGSSNKGSGPRRKNIAGVIELSNFLMKCHQNLCFKVNHTFAKSYRLS
ncbi:MAG TPA: hypothetical protein VMS35_00185 [Nitrososphaeraceae archaeon]|nr:hypothetical protein [Nitrososphaeraceae archaeon]